MARLKFDDIDEWTPASISIVDKPAHPLCTFEVYEDDEEYVKKSIEISNTEGEIMVEETIKDNEPTIEVSQSFFEKLLGRSILKSEEPTPVKKDDEEEDEIPGWAKDILSRLEKLEKEKTPAPGAVPKNESAEGEGETPAEDAEPASETEEEVEETEEPVIDEEEVVSKSIDPDLVTSTSTDKPLVERAGRKSNGMTW